MNAHAIHLMLTRGQCRWCRCTEFEPCDVGCGWANREETLCTACVPLDRAMRTIPGRRELAGFLQEHGFLASAQLKPRECCKRPFCQRPRKSPRHTLCTWHSEA